MGKCVRIGLSQINVTVGDLEGNKRKIKEYMELGYEKGVSILVFPELCITGYPPEDLLLHKDFVEGNLKVLKEVTKFSNKVLSIVGFVAQKNSQLYNAAALIYDCSIVGIYHKQVLPNYGVFDEKRYFARGSLPLMCRFGPLNLGVSICEDIWVPETPVNVEADIGAQIILILNASPFYCGKVRVREQILSRLSAGKEVFSIYVNLVGGQDELVFDGNSMVLGPNGKVIAKAPAFKEDLLVVDIDLDTLPKKDVKLKEKGQIEEIVINNPMLLDPGLDLKGLGQVDYLDPVEEVYGALILGLTDYVKKNGFDKVVLGLSGGIDSSLVATIACDALGHEAVKGVFMPSPYTSKESKEDVFELVRNLQMELFEVPITETYEAYLRTLAPVFRGRKEDITEENIQARIRGNILMAISNKFGWLVLTTGNKSEMSVGYATLYGDMAGGFAVIKDVPKTMVYELCKFRNKMGKVIPHRVLIKEPSAELRPGQKDTDTLPPYELLDRIIKAYVEEDRGFDEIVGLIGDRVLVEKVIRMIDGNEYKRRQAPPGIKITPKAFGKDRRMPITNGFRHHLKEKSKLS